MNALRSEWVSEEAASRAHALAQEAYETGLHSLAIPVISAAADSYVNQRLLSTDRSDIVGPQYENDIYNYMRPRNDQEANFRNRLEYLEDNTEISTDEVEVLEDMWDLRNNYLHHNDGSVPEVNRNTIEHNIQALEELLGVEEPNSSLQIEGNTESRIREGSLNEQEYFEILASTAYQHENGNLNLLATFPAYNRISQEIDHYSRPIQSRLEENTEDGLVDGERIYTNLVDNPSRFVAFENQRNMISHDIEAYTSIDIPEFMENIDFVLDQLINEENFSESLSNWNTWSNLCLGPPMYKTEPIF